MSELEIIDEGFEFVLKQNHFLLSKEKCVFWKERGWLIISDLHLGKAGHFRKHGIPIPRQVHISDFHRINDLIQTYQPSEIVFLGDLFHSDQNEEWDDFIYWTEQVDIPLTLVKGNHDILDAAYYELSKMTVVDDLKAGPFHFTHEPSKSELYNIAGHIHPGYILKQSARQSERFPCFYFGKGNALMPSFGNFTGNHAIKPEKGSLVFLIAKDVLVRLAV